MMKVSKENESKKADKPLSDKLIEIAFEKHMFEGAVLFCNFLKYGLFLLTSGYIYSSKFANARQFPEVLSGLILWYSEIVLDFTNHYDEEFRKQSLMCYTIIKLNLTHNEFLLKRINKYLVRNMILKQYKFKQHQLIEICIANDNKEFFQIWCQEPSGNYLNASNNVDRCLKLAFKYEAIEIIKFCIKYYGKDWFMPVYLLKALKRTTNDDILNFLMDEYEQCSQPFLADDIMEVVINKDLDTIFKRLMYGRPCRMGCDLKKIEKYAESKNNKCYEVIKKKKEAELINQISFVEESWDENDETWDSNDELQWN